MVAMNWPAPIAACTCAGSHSWEQYITWYSINNMARRNLASQNMIPRASRLYALNRTAGLRTMPLAAKIALPITTLPAVPMDWISASVSELACWYLNRYNVIKSCEKVGLFICAESTLLKWLRKFILVEWTLQSAHYRTNCSKIKGSSPPYETVLWS